MNETLKLYYVKVVAGAKYEGSMNAYVIASNPDEAYRVLREYLDSNDYGFLSERKLDSITLIAEEDERTRNLLWGGKNQ